MNSEQMLAHIYRHVRLIVRDEIKKAFELYLEQSHKESSTINEAFLSSEQAAQYLKIKLRTLYAKVEKGELPAYRTGKRKLIFSKEELKKYIIKNKT